MNDQVQQELKKIFNGRFSTSESTRANYARGEDTYDPILSKAVVFPETNEEVSKILRLCNQHKIPVVPFGTGTSLEGNVVGNDKGICTDLSFCIGVAPKASLASSASLSTSLIPKFVNLTTGGSA